MAEPRKAYVLAVMQMHQSLNIAVEKAGGGMWYLDTLEKTSALDFMMLLAPNGIRFVFEDPNDGPR